MATDSYLRLLPTLIAQAILESSSSQRHAFARACASLTVDHCVMAVLGADAAAESTFAALRARAQKTVDTDEASATDELLAAREDAFGQELTRLRKEELPGSYTQFVRISTQRHAVRALRAMLVADGVSAAARAAFETISAMKYDDGVARLAREHLASARLS